MEPDFYEVVIIRYPSSQRPSQWRDEPRGGHVIERRYRRLARGPAVTFAKAFNRQELRHPHGVWAIVRREA